MYKNNKKYGFTLTEVIIVLVILGALALILVPNMLKMAPDDHNIKYKKAFYTVQEIMNDIVNDNTICTGMVGAAGNEVQVADNQFLMSCTGVSLWQLFYDKLSTTQTDLNAGDNITTTNGMIWAIPTTPINNVNGDSINVSLDGKDPSDLTLRNSDNDRNKNGIFEIIINQSGKVTPGGNVEQNLLLEDPTKD